MPWHGVRRRKKAITLRKPESSASCAANGCRAREYEQVSLPAEAWAFWSKRLDTRRCNLDTWRDSCSSWSARRGRRCAAAGHEGREKESGRSADAARGAPMFIRPAGRGSVGTGIQAALVRGGFSIGSGANTGDPRYTSRLSRPLPPQKANITVGAESVSQAWHVAIVEEMERARGSRQRTRCSDRPRGSRAARIFFFSFFFLGPGSLPGAPSDQGALRASDGVSAAEVFSVRRDCLGRVGDRRCATASCLLSRDHDVPPSRARGRSEPHGLCDRPPRMTYLWGAGISNLWSGAPLGAISSERGSWPLLRARGLPLHREGRRRGGGWRGRGRRPKPTR